MTRLVEDRALLDGFRRGDSEALTIVYREYARPLFALLVRGFGYQSGGRQMIFKGFKNSWESENLVQEVFARAFAPQAREAYDGLRPYRNYLFSIARNLVIDELRKSGRETPVSDEELDLDGRKDSPLMGRPDPGPEKNLSEQELNTRVQDFVAGLQNIERAVFQVRFLEGQSVQDSAVRLKMTEHAVKREEKKLKKRFFLVMREHGYFRSYRMGRAGIEKILFSFILQLGARIP